MDNESPTLIRELSHLYFCHQMTVFWGISLHHVQAYSEPSKVGIYSKTRQYHQSRHKKGIGVAGLYVAQRGGKASNR